MLDDTRLPSVSRFLRNRFLRIYPAYVVIFLIAALGLGLVYTRSVPAYSGVTGTADTVGRMTDVPLLLANLGLFHTLMPWSIKTGLGVSWSLTTELVFYLVLPLLGLLAAAVARRRSTALAVWAPVVLLLCVGSAGRLAATRLTTASSSEQRFFLEWGASWQAVFARSFIAQADLFAIGMMAAVVWGLSIRRVLSRTQTLTFQIGLGVLSVSFFVTERIGLETEVAFALSAASFLVLLSLPTRRGRPFWIARVLEIAPSAGSG